MRHKRAPKRQMAGELYLLPAWCTYGFPRSWVKRPWYSWGLHKVKVSVYITRHFNSKYFLWFHVFVLPNKNLTTASPKHWHILECKTSVAKCHSHAWFSRHRRKRNPLHVCVAWWHALFRIPTNISCYTFNCWRKYARNSRHNVIFHGHEARCPSQNLGIK